MKLAVAGNIKPLKKIHTFIEQLISMDMKILNIKSCLKFVVVVLRILKIH